MIRRSTDPKSAHARSSAAVPAAATGGILLAQNGEPPPTTAPQERSATPLEEVVVTAQKRTENLLDVPVPVTAINADTLVQQNLLRLQDYFSKIPGLNVELDGTTGVPTISIRGITTGGQTNPTVGITVDDVPYGSSTFIGGGFVSPDIDPSDLARIEVLRGPQGTLYGVSSIGGLLKYVTLDPSMERFSGLVQAGTADVSNGAQPGYSLRGAVNVPLGDTLAVRATGYSRLDPGYIDNIQTGERGVNWGTATGGHFSALWQPLPDLSVKLSALLQDNDVHGSPLADTGPGFGDLQQSFLRGTGGYQQRFQAYSANITLKLGAFDLTSVTGYGINTTSLSYDLTPIYGPLTEMFFGVTGSPYYNDLKTEKFSQELRLAGPILSSLEWLFGVFYTHENSSYISDVLAQDPNGKIVGQALYYTNPSTYEEGAVFTDFTWHATDRFSIQMGGRESHIRQNNSAYGSGPLNGGVTVTPNAESTENAFTYLLTPQLRITPSSLLYARLASGYRAGGPNPNALVNHVPSQYDPDKTENYDLGFKADLSDHTLSLDMALYYIDWKDVQVTVEAPGGAAVYISNGGGAKSEGAELSIDWKPLKGLTLGAWVAWNEAVLTKDFPPGSSAYGVSGDRLPYSSRFSGNLSVDQDFRVTKDVTGFLGGAVSYVGDRVGLFQTTAVRQDYPGYARVDLHGGVKGDAWTVNLYVNNLADRRAPLQGGLDGPNTYANAESFIYIQPRTVGLSLSYRF
jgi:outer membrane receptor protein involved in Fe transport